jgi:hypothetical protein
MSASVPPGLVDKLLNVRSHCHPHDIPVVAHAAAVLASLSRPSERVVMQLGTAICWLRLLATRFKDEWPETANAANSHANDLEEILSGFGEV